MDGAKKKGVDGAERVQGRVQGGACVFGVDGEEDALGRLRAILQRYRLVPVARLDSARDAEPLAEALERAGLPLLLVELTTPAAPVAIRAIRSTFTGFTVGAGGMHSEGQVREALKVGAHFGAGPVMNPGLLAAASSAGLPFLPGAMTPSEIECGIRWGCSIQCIYPAAAIGGPPMVRALAETFQQTRMSWVPFGGVRAEDFQDYLAVPGVCAVAGGFVCEPVLIEAGMWEDIEAQAALCRRKADAAVRGRPREDPFHGVPMEEPQEIYR
jgi:2-dehydro-3-deoxyphosphogluconate aldolase/(4S)-4-hydroxy-2-oxoglutarate aldolase